MSLVKAAPINDSCSNCLKPERLCVCAAIARIQTRKHVLILQHPQEPDKELGSARLAHLCLPNSTLKIGLSWPNLTKALGAQAIPGRWAVLYLGSGIKAGPSNFAAPQPGSLVFVTKSGVPDPTVRLRDIDGLVCLDGTWSQAKALWWRNAWLLKLRRAILVPKVKSLYGNLRREPRRECLSTIESIAEALCGLGEAPEAGQKLKEIFGTLLDKQRGKT